MARFLPLQVTDVRKDTRDAVVVTLRPRSEDAAAFRFTQGQYLTFRREFDGEEVRRSYSICSGANEGVLQVGIKRVDGGTFSTWANENLKPGTEIDAMAPMGHFNTPIDPASSRNYLAFAVGSGITPILSIIKTTLALEPRATFTLVYANRQMNAIMFREELEDIKNSYLGRFNLVHILKNEAQEVELFSGRLDADKCAALFKHWIDVSAVATAFICGPEPMMKTVAGALRDHGLRDEQIKFELFGTAQPARPRPRADQNAAASGTCAVTVTLDGATRAFAMQRSGQSLLEAARDHDMDAPFACKAGVCSTCRAKVLEGEVEMLTNHALEDYEVRAGYVLTCQCYPLTDHLVVTYDQ